jgi:hypothetical protein
MQRKTKKLHLVHETIRALSANELIHAVGGSQHQQTEGGCTKKNSECNGCGSGPTTIM